MSLIRLPSPSLGLPQSRLFVRRDYPVRALINVGSGFLDLVSGRPCTLTGAVQRTVGPAGRRFHAASSSIYAESPTGIANGKPLTLLVVSTSTSGSSVAAISDARASWSCPKIDSTSGVITAYCKVSGGTQLSITGPTVTVGKTYVAAAHWRPGVGLKASFDGGAVQSSSHSATTLHVAPSTLWMGGGTGSNVYLLAAIAGELTDDQLRALSSNPWSLFEPEDHLLWWPSADAGGNISASGAAAAAGSATLQADVALAGVAVALAGGAAAAQVSVPLSATGLSVSSGSAGLTATITVSAAGLAEAAGAAGLSASVLLAGAAAATAAGNASLAATLAAAASGSAQAGGSATLSGGSPGALSATGSATAGGSAGLDVQLSLSAAGSAAAGGSAILGGGAAGSLSASGAAQAGGSGLLTASVALTAAGFVQAMGAGALFVSIDLAASGQATAGGLAHLALQGATVLAIDPRYRVRLLPREFLAAWSRPPYSVTLQ